MNATTLHHPVGLRELELIAESGFCAFPPRLPDQPIFYPVLNFPYAERIANEWNTTYEPFVGFVTSFDVDAVFLKRYDVQVVGDSTLQELWVPAEDLDEFNSHILGPIRVEKAYYGTQYRGEIDNQTNLPPRIASQIAQS